MFSHLASHYAQEEANRYIFYLFNFLGLWVQLVIEFFSNASSRHLLCMLLGSSYVFQPTIPASDSV